MNIERYCAQCKIFGICHIFGEGVGDIIACVHSFPLDEIGDLTDFGLLLEDRGGFNSYRGDTMIPTVSVLLLMFLPTVDYSCSY